MLLIAAQQFQRLSLIQQCGDQGIKSRSPLEQFLFCCCLGDGVHWHRNPWGRYLDTNNRSLVLMTPSLL